MDKDEALCMALGALEFYYDLYKEKVDANAITAIKEALAQSEQEPVAMRYDFDGYGWLYIDNGSGSNWKEKIKNAEPLYTAPPQREWVGLTDEEIEAIGKDDKVLLAQFHTSVKAIDEMKDPTAQIMNLVIRQQGFNFAKAIEAKLREENGG